MNAKQRISDITLYDTSIKIYNDLGEDDKFVFKELASSNKEIGELFSLMTGEYENYDISRNIKLYK